MEKYKCKLCYRDFANGRALGGHMRSHMLNLYVSSKAEQEQLGEEYESTHSYSDGDYNEEEHENEDKGLLNYELRENPKKSFRLVDPEFSFTAAVGASSGVVQDIESETESFKNHDLRRRSKRIQIYDHEISGYELKKSKLSHEKVSCFETNSSISDTTEEEDVAYCLIMLSRDNWSRPRRINKYISMDYFDVYNNEDEEEEDEDEEEVVTINKSGNKGKGKYRCETCNKMFKSYQALGGHRASHKKIKATNVQISEKNTKQNSNSTNAGGLVEKIHECPVCFRVFASGQALGGHKRSHGIGSSNISVAATAVTHSNMHTIKEFSKCGGETALDLNLPAPVDEDEFSSQVELSAVSDAEFVHP